jgi:hypothetical protein
MFASKSLLLLACLLVFTACGGQSFTVKHAPGFSPNGRHISVFAVKRDGLLSRSGWEALGPNLSAPFGGNACEVAYSEPMLNALPDLAAAVDSVVRANGVSDELLAKLAPAAKGDTIMLMTIAGHPHASSDSGSQTQAANSMSSRNSGRRGGRGGLGGGMPVSSGKSDSAGPDPFTVSAIFFSVSEHHSVASIELNYSGTDMSEALNLFRTRLETEFPGAKCSGWDWTVALDPLAIRALNEQ